MPSEVTRTDHFILVHTTLQVERDKFAWLIRRQFSMGTGLLGTCHSIVDAKPGNIASMRHGVEDVVDADFCAHGGELDGVAGFVEELPAVA